MGMKTYRALEAGFDGKKVQPAGAIFTTDIKKGSWMEPVGADADALDAAEVAADPNFRADPDYESLTVAVLRGLAAEAGIPHDGVNKAELVAALNAKARGKI